MSIARITILTNLNGQDCHDRPHDSKKFDMVTTITIWLRPQLYWWMKFAFWFLYALVTWCRLRNCLFNVRCNASFRFDRAYVNLDVKGPIGRREGSQTNFTNESQTQLPADTTDLNKIKCGGNVNLCTIKNI